MRLRQLSNTIEGEIIPRLMVAFDQSTDNRFHEAEDGNGAAGIAAPTHFPNDAVSRFVDLVLAHDATVACEFVRTLHSQQVSLDRIYLDLLAPAANRLGVMWESDACSFVDVTMGVTRMHQVLLEYSPSFCAQRARDARTSQNAMIVPVPGEQHTFGMYMLSEFFRRAGWNVYNASPSSDNELADLLGSHRFDIVGLSASGDRYLDGINRRVELVRDTSLERDSRVLLGGRAFTENRSLADDSGADGTAADAPEALRLANQLLRH